MNTLTVMSGESHHFDSLYRDYSPWHGVLDMELLEKLVMAVGTESTYDANGMLNEYEGSNEFIEYAASFNADEREDLFHWIFEELKEEQDIYISANPFVDISELTEEELNSYFEECNEIAIDEVLENWFSVTTPYLKHGSRVLIKSMYFIKSDGLLHNIPIRGCW